MKKKIISGWQGEVKNVSADGYGDKIEEKAKLFSFCIIKYFMIQ